MLSGRPGYNLLSGDGKDMMSIRGGRTLWAMETWQQCTVEPIQETHELPISLRVISDEKVGSSNKSKC